jgi:hypothetical protein
MIHAVAETLFQFIWVQPGMGDPRLLTFANHVLVSQAQAANQVPSQVGLHLFLLRVDFRGQKDLFHI